MHYFPYLLLFLGGCTLTVGDIIMKKWVLNNDRLLFIFGLLVYLVGLVFLSYSFKYKNIAVASTIFVIVNIATLSLISWAYFKEPLSPLQMVGITLGVSSILFLELA
ncbi:MAG: hypothetical protein ACD_81C00051G0004 [uncultured bacterium]|uniref:Cation/cationic drug transporter n=2 Tax=Candidatus Wolfeibacteriota TaxID=1752735 RepID=A0A0G1H7T2_9BACT|nr:MAG: hypothetical protein ACD_81C00051G0004 [uncultured bacterium]KKR12489.1 MAG: Cation/cationic drug transporter [Candidatus Wolfebacteria bacterium GW2011_GWC2_39_22]KKT43446.1 MAG: Cation/cationic drug transporter [Candidatus Wolfebacteria bacterium GW2011_GWE2_44_13]HBI25282.1 hypothetical protein [Candidatus Wolfebacteria bacterium]